MLDQQPHTVFDKLQALFPNRREDLWRHVLQKGLPSKREEVFQYLRLQQVLDFPWQRGKSEGAPAKGNASFLFWEGKYRSEFSSPPPSLVALRLSEAFATYGHYLEFRLKCLLEEEADFFTLLNAAAYEEGLFIYLPPGLKLEKPVEILFGAEEGGVILLPRIHVYAAKGSSIQLILKRDEMAQPLWINESIDIAAEEGADVSLMDLAVNAASSFRFTNVRASLKKGSRFQSVCGCRGGSLSRYDYHVKLLGEGADCSLKGLWNLEGSSQHHVNVHMRHLAPAACSHQLFKGVLKEVSKSSFIGKIFVDQKAQKTQAYQLNRNLILGERASANAKPNLEIFADDVKASHGATVGRLNEEDLFYLSSRGMEKQQAKALLIHGFMEEIIQAFSSGGLAKQAERLLIGN